MIGALVCWKKHEDGTGHRVVLYAVSGNNKQLEAVRPFKNLFVEKSVFVPSIVSSDKIDKALEENDLQIHKLTDQINKLTLVNKSSPERKQLIEQRTCLTDASLKNVFSLYAFTRFDGKPVTLDEIIKLHGGHLPPTGTGDCCAPKLLSYAFAHELEPVSMDEVYFGRDTKNKQNGISYPPCDERCGYILPSILGLEILYRDKDIVVVNKQSGLLSVPGKGEDKQDCVESRVRNLFPKAPVQCAVHRLDMETSGILICALNPESHRRLNEQFAAGLVHKKYIALLDGILRGKPEGRTELPFRLDPDNRPHQIYDEVNGKLGITEWKKLGIEKFQTGSGEKTVTRIEFSPLTGRTHQLRLASSCSVERGGLGIPIVGDSLYGECRDDERLMLHAAEITFCHPTSGELLHIVCEPEF
ncbi:tRNA pseudouridine32 synthase / 23S rRNA pseudouridine746 synthase [Treponema bryantii]|uniref:tRNA pseudouridine32 synthase / 23S rRNA pseudouridine746 synthase n=2 Tax=Treponema bryantii TaxID=163 RepID=A0A1H8ZWW9_9SPIR|nr:tRNA pseudouridine32 synthase / 23S rRNA pseudouridine746 synthase [Treponema bryantii]